MIPRIIALTDGEDNSSNVDAVDVTVRIIQNKIILDSFVVGENC